MRNKVFTKINMIWENEFNVPMLRHTGRLKLSRTRFFQSVIEGMTDKDIDVASKKGCLIIEKRRQDYLTNRREFREKLNSISDEDIDAMIAKQNKKPGE